MKKLLGTLREFRRLFNEVVIVDMLCGNDKEVAKEITLRHFALVELPCTVVGLLLFGAFLGMFA